MAMGNQMRPSLCGNQTLAYDVENRTGGSWYELNNRPLDRGGAWNLYGRNGERLETVTLGYFLTRVQISCLTPFQAFRTLGIARL